MPSDSAAAGNAVASGLHPGLASLQPRRRDRLPEAAVSEGAHHRLPVAPLRLRLATERRPPCTCHEVKTPLSRPGLNSLGRLFAKRTPRPKAAGPTPGRVVCRSPDAASPRAQENLTHS